MYVVIGATGNTGSVVAEKLLSQGQKVRVLGRDPHRLEQFAKKGAEAVVADVSDGNALAKALSGATALYAMIPPNMSAPDVRAFQSQVSSAISQAVQKSGVKHVVALSSVGADKPDRTGPVLGLYDLETRLAAITGLNVLCLRAGYFMENILPQVGVIQSFGMLAGPLRADLPIAMIAARDIGAAAAEALRKLDFQGWQTRELLGPADVTYAQVARTIGAAIGRPDLSYQQMPAEQLKPALMQIGMSANLADLLLEMSESLNSGYMKPLEPRSPANTTPTNLETFVAEVFVPAYRGAAAGA
jgi:uncharacterized protein YbjT (DUF2867 family)